jgi:hypothetical protein
MSLKKVLITPYFGPMPEWMDKFKPPKGYEWILDQDLEGFKKRVYNKLLVNYPGEYGTGKVWDYRCALGLLYQEEIESFDYWGHMDFDVVFGDMDHFLPDSELSKVDVYSSHHEYVCGCFSLYRNVTAVNYLFMRQPQWKEFLNKPEPNAWVEKEYSRVLEKSGLSYTYEFRQGNPWDREPKLRKDNNRLYQWIKNDWEEIMFFHFRHSKRWPL